MSNIDIYYTSTEKEYGFFVQKRKHNGRDGNGAILLLGQGEFSGGNDALLSIEKEILLSLLELKGKGLIDKKSNINFFYPELMNVDKKSSTNDSVKIESSLTELQIKMVNEIREIKTIFTKNELFFHTSLINDKSRDVISLMKHEMIEKCLRTNTFEISNDLLRKKMLPHHRKELLRVKGSKSLKGFLAKVKPEIRGKMRATSDYKKLLSDVVNKEMSIDKRLNVSDHSVKGFYDVNKVNSLVIYTDGSLSKLSKKMNRNKHGYGVSVLDGETGKALFKFRGGMTKHAEALDHIEIVELYAIYRAALFIDKKMKAGELNPDASIEIRTDSKDCVNKFEKYIDGNLSVLGSELFNELKRLTEDKVFCLTWVRGHAEDENNIEVDKLARAGLKMEGHNEYATLYSSPEKEMNELMEATAHIEDELHAKRFRM